jgi:nicotinate phosphoribosyltransferase
LITGQCDAALDGVYKLSMIDNKPTLKLTENVDKVSLPGVKKIYRYYNGDGKFYADGILLVEEENIEKIYHPLHSNKSSKISELEKEELIEKVMEKGEIKIENKSVKEISDYVRHRLTLLPEEHKRFENPHLYKIGISTKLFELRIKLIEKFHQR